MSARAMNVFTPILREVEAGLTLPIPDRVKLLRELEADLEELTNRFIADGLSPDDALARAREALVPDERSLRALHTVHQPLYRRMTRSIARDRLLAVERLLLSLTTLSVVLGGGTTLLRADLLGNPSSFLWPVMGWGGLLFAAVAGKVFQLWVKRDHEKPARGLGAILTLSGLTVATGLLGLLFDLYRLAARVEIDAAQATALVTEWLIRDTALLSVSILIALSGGLIWFVLAQWVSAIEEDHRDVLGLNRTIRSRRGN